MTLAFVELSLPDRGGQTMGGMRGDFEAGMRRGGDNGVGNAGWAVEDGVELAFGPGEGTVIELEETGVCARADAADDDDVG